MPASASGPRTAAPVRPRSPRRETRPPDPTRPHRTSNAAFRLRPVEARIDHDLPSRLHPYAYVHTGHFRVRLTLDYRLPF